MESWHLIRHSVQSPAWNMACDEWLLSKAASFVDPILRIYGWDRPSITIGYFQKYPFEFESKYTIVRRPTGGALVYHDRDLTFSVVLPPSHPWKQLSTSNRYFKVHDRIRKIFENRSLPVNLASQTEPTLPNPSGRNPLGEPCFTKQTRYDIVLGGKKIAGGAQRVTRQGLLHQGSIQAVPCVTEDELRKAWEESESMLEEFSMTESDLRSIQTLSSEKYENPAWNRKL